MTNRLLDATLICMYDYSKMSKEVRKIFSTLSLMRIKYENVPLPTITPTYEIRYSAPTRSTTSKVEDYVIKKISKEENLNEYIDKIVGSLKKLNKEELIVFSESFINGLDDDNIGMKVAACRDMVLKIRKSAVIKFLSSLGEDERFIVNN